MRFVGDNEKCFYIMNSCGNAAGQYMPPFILYKGKDFYAEWTEGGPDDAIYATSPSGWMETEAFVQWFKAFVHHVRVERKLTGPIILYFDGHKSHISVEVVDIAQENNIRFTLTPPNSSQYYQPMDGAEKKKNTQEKKAANSENNSLKKKRGPKKKQPLETSVLNGSKRCFVCPMIHINDDETNKLVWRNYEFILNCSNWYCSRCLPASSSKSDEFYCSERQKKQIKIFCQKIRNLFDNNLFNNFVFLDL